MLPKLKTFWKCNSYQKMSPEVVVCIEGMAFIFITCSFYFIYFYFVLLLLQKIMTSLQKSGGGKAPSLPGSAGPAEDIKSHIPSSSK